jgi:MYXO-CTERM domain-containing protein
VAPTLASLDAMVEAALATVTSASTPSVTTVPEPTAAGLGVLGFAAMLRRRRR